MVMNAGIDEAGRGPVLGNMVMAIVACAPKDRHILQKMGVKDSKLLSPKKRNELYRLIRSHFPHAIIKVTPKEIDKHVTADDSSLNRLEAITSGKLIKRLNAKTRIDSVMLDLPAKNKEEYLNQVKEKLTENDKEIKIDAEFKADLNHIEVSAASILAKVTRDKALATVEKKIGIKTGSGYPADPNTVKALAKHFDRLTQEGVIRQSWKTAKAIVEAKAQKNLTDF